MNTGHNGFTLIELLIVVAIISILAAIALPNYMGAQIRAKNTRATADMRELFTAYESYYVDYQIYPPHYFRDAQGQRVNNPIIHTIGQHQYISTPIAYSSNQWLDPYYQKSTTQTWIMPVYHVDTLDKEQTDTAYITFEGNVALGNHMLKNQGARYISHSLGPDRKYTDSPVSDIRYDPSNGLQSPGNIYRSGPIDVVEWVQ